MVQGVLTAKQVDDQRGHPCTGAGAHVLRDVEFVDTECQRDIRRLSAGEVRWRGIDEVADLIVVDIDGKDDMVCLDHELLAEV